MASPRWMPTLRISPVANRPVEEPSRRENISSAAWTRIGRVEEARHECIPDGLHDLPSVPPGDRSESVEVQADEVEGVHIADARVHRRRVLEVREEEGQVPGLHPLRGRDGGKPEDGERQERRPDRGNERQALAVCAGHCPGIATDVEESHGAGHGGRPERDPRKLAALPGAAVPIPPDQEKAARTSEPTKRPTPTTDVALTSGANDAGIAGGLGSVGYQRRPSGRSASRRQGAWRRRRQGPASAARNASQGGQSGRGGRREPPPRRTPACGLR